MILTFGILTLIRVNTRIFVKTSHKRITARKVSKYGPEITPYLDFFQAVHEIEKLF